MSNFIHLSPPQRLLMSGFYNKSFTKTVISKRDRKKLWLNFKFSRSIPDSGLDKICPALQNEMRRSIESKRLVQSAVFSECVYAQTLANMYELDIFHVFETSLDCLDPEITQLAFSHKLRPRYIYQSADNDRVLVQAGGPNGVDCALIEVLSQNIFTIEFKEPAAKTSEPDLPNYGEDGFLQVTSDFLFKYPQFEYMLAEQTEKRLNFVESAGSNVNDFSEESIKHAVSENYAATKFADVICTEDKSNFLTMLPANQLSLWARIKGEIRPAGRNKYKVWTPALLIRLIESIGGTVNDSTISILEENLSSASARGGDGTVSRYKLNPLFFVYSKDVKFEGRLVQFDLSDVRQLKPTVAAHMFFDELEVSSVRLYYSPEIKNG